METHQSLNLYITYVEKEGPFLKLWGQTDKNNALYVEQFLAGVGLQFDTGAAKVSPESLQCGTLVCAKYKDNKYYRARIANVFVRDNLVEVTFIDFGNKDIVSCGNIRSLQNFPSPFISIPPLASGFIFAETHCVGGGEWNETIFESIAKEIKYREVQCHLLAQATQYYLVKIFLDGTDLCSFLVQRGLMQPIALQAQQAVLLSMSIQKQSSQTSAPTSTSASINTYKACTLEPGCLYHVYVSYVNDGPCHFSVQLKQSEDALAKLMNDINSIPLKLLEDVPIPGTICLARCQEDGNVCRAVVTNEVDNQFKVFYVDFGNYETVPLDCLYQIPFKYVIPKVMAIRFTLAGVEKSTVTIEMQVAFKKFVDNRMLHMKVLPTPVRTAFPKCELWDPETKTSALDIVNRAAQHAYPEPVSLTRGFSQPVKVSFVYSCSRFFVQLVSKENELANLMMSLQEICQTSGLIEPSDIKPGIPCCALFLADSQWYRSQVVEVLSETVKVRYIDYGNEEEVLITHLKTIDGEHLTVLRPQAIECCLNGYQNMEEDVERDGFLEEIILESCFTMKVVDMVGKKALVDLFDASNYNVASLLLDKIAAATSQVSPMLVQAGNKIEHRKSYSQQREEYTNPREGQRNDRDNRTGRDNSNWNGKPNDRSEKPWRQENRENRNFDKNTNENNDWNSRRQNNKGFSPNNQRHNRQKSQETDSQWNTNENSTNNNSNWNATETSAPAANDGWQDTDSNTLTANEWNTGGQDSNTLMNNDWNASGKDRGDGHDKRNNDYGNKRRFDNDRGDRFAGKPRDGGYGRKPDYRKDGTEISSSGSEKSFHKGPRTSSRNDRGGGRGGKFDRNFDKPRGKSFNNNSVSDESWNVSAVTPSIDAAPATSAFGQYDVVGSEAKVIISWFHNPSHFFCQVVDYQDQFKSMMDEIQEFYKNRKPELSVVGAPVIGLFPEDNVLYRAKILEVIGTQYKVYYVDFGNVSTIEKIWPIDKKFMNLPAQAIICSLCGIAAPSGSNWSDPDTYSTYFDKDGFTCKFINKDETKTYVNISYGSEDIAQLLIRDGLAVSTQSAIPDIEIPLLLGQQFRAVVKSVNNLSDIIIALECGLAINCSMHNVEIATETFEDHLRSLLEQTVIVYVDNVLEDRLEVTLYDTEFNKHIILNPDEGAFETVDGPCPMLVLRSTITGYVTYADTSSVFIQPTEYSEVVTYLLDQLFAVYNEMTQDDPIIPEEGALYAVRSEDGNWYRGRVISFDDEKASVCYIDYGNSEDVAFTELRELTKNFFDISVLSLQVTVPSNPESFIDKEVTANIFYGENGWEGIVEISESSATESAKVDESADTGIATSSLEKPEEFSEPSTISADAVISTDQIVDVVGDELEAPVNSEQQQDDEVAATGTFVYASHIDSPNEIYLQFLETLTEIEQLQQQIQAEVSDWPVLENRTAGVLCAAPYSGDQQWYRAEILDADDEITTVRFIDFGNTDVIDNKTTEVKTLPYKLLSLAVYATRCSLKLRPVDEEWSATALKVFEELAIAESVTAEFLDQNEKSNFIELYSAGVNVREALIRDNLAVDLTQATEAKSTGFVSHLNSPSEFWIQLENCVDELEWIAEQLSSADSFAELEDLTPGTLCAALFPDDQMWYRARILSNTVGGIELLFIDYGNSCMSSSLRQLPEDLVVTQPLAQKCSLQRPAGIVVWSAEAAAKFAEISADGQTIFTVKKLATGETSVVQLLVDGKDVATMLLPVTEDGYVKEVESLEKFEVEKASGEKVEGSFQLEAMNGQELNEEAERNFEQMNEQGTTLFQIEFVNTNTVRLYINGCDIRPQLGGMKNSTFDAPIADDFPEKKVEGANEHLEEEVKIVNIDGTNDFLPSQPGDALKTDNESSEAVESPAPDNMGVSDPDAGLSNEETVSSKTESPEGSQPSKKTEKSNQDLVPPCETLLISEPTEADNIKETVEPQSPGDQDDNKPDSTDDIVHNVAEVLEPIMDDHPEKSVEKATENFEEEVKTLNVDISNDFLPCQPGDALKTDNESSEAVESPAPDNMGLSDPDVSPSNEETVSPKTESPEDSQPSKTEKPNQDLMEMVVAPCDTLLVREPTEVDSREETLEPQSPDHQDDNKPGSTDDTVQNVAEVLEPIVDDFLLCQPGDALKTDNESSEAVKSPEPDNMRGSDPDAGPSNEETVSSKTECPEGSQPSKTEKPNQDLMEMVVPPCETLLDSEPTEADSRKETVEPQSAGHQDDNKPGSTDYTVQNVAEVLQPVVDDHLEKDVEKVNEPFEEEIKTVDVDVSNNFLPCQSGNALKTDNESSGAVESPEPGNIGVLDPDVSPSNEETVSPKTESPEGSQPYKMENPNEDLMEMVVPTCDTLLVSEPTEADIKKETVEPQSPGHQDDNKPDSTDDIAQNVAEVLEPIESSFGVPKLDDHPEKEVEGANDYLPSQPGDGLKTDNESSEAVESPAPDNIGGSGPDASPSNEETLSPKTESPEGSQPSKTEKLNQDLMEMVVPPCETLLVSVPTEDDSRKETVESQSPGHQGDNKHDSTDDIVQNAADILEPIESSSSPHSPEKLQQLSEISSLEEGAKSKSTKKASSGEKDVTSSPKSTTKPSSSGSKVVTPKKAVPPPITSPTKPPKESCKVIVVSKKSPTKVDVKSPKKSSVSKTGDSDPVKKSSPVKSAAADSTKRSSPGKTITSSSVKKTSVGSPKKVSPEKAATPKGSPSSVTAGNVCSKNISDEKSLHQPGDLKQPVEEVCEVENVPLDSANELEMESKVKRQLLSSESEEICLNDDAKKEIVRESTEPETLDCKEEIEGESGGVD